MACRKGCGSSVANMELLVKDIIRQMIDEGKLQEGLVDCTEKRLWRDANVVTCDLLGDAVCQLFEDGSLCIDTVDSVAYDETTGKLCLLFTNGNKTCTTLSLDDTKLTGVTFDAGTRKATFKMSDNGTFTLDLSKLLSQEQIGDGLEYVGNKLKVKVDGTTIKLENGVLKAVLPEEYDDAEIKRRLTALENKQHSASVELKGLFDEDVGFAHTTAEKD